MTSARQALIDHIGAYSFRTDGPYTLASGQTADWYIDARHTTFSGAGAELVAAAMMEILDEEVKALGGMTMGADPIAIATAALSGGRLDAFSIRKADKDHGTGGRLVGPVEPGTPVTVVEDTTTTGTAFLDAVDVATGAGLRVVQTVSLFDRSSGAAAELMADRALPYTALAGPSDLGVEG